MFKDKKYRVRPLHDILEDIDMAKAYYGHLDQIFLADGDAISLSTPDLLKILHKLSRFKPHQSGWGYYDR
jgi:coproporphyrinogen III oxidase-like Fe-S oxidoreductase